MRPPQHKGERWYYTERQMAILDSPQPHWSVPDREWREWMDVHDNVAEHIAIGVVRVDPPEAKDLAWRRGGTYQDMERAARRLEDWFIWDFRCLGGALLGWPSHDRPDGWIHHVRFIENDRETTEVLAWIERDLRRLGAEEPSEWLVEELEAVQRRWYGG